MNAIPITPNVLDRMTEVLRDAARPTRIILFGSQARGTADSGSDYDLLVVEPGVPDRVGEMVRLRRLLSPLRVCVDLLVLGEASFRDQAAIPGNWVYEAATEGRVLYESR
ncbi:MAG: nucleotidyltransferase domain-containing protein [Candidatus Coatesbacteria bacterium]